MVSKRDLINRIEYLLSIKEDEEMSETENKMVSLSKSGLNQLLIEFSKAKLNKEKIDSINYGLSRMLGDFDYYTKTNFGNELGEYLRDNYLFWKKRK